MKQMVLNLFKYGIILLFFSQTEMARAVCYNHIYDVSILVEPNSSNAPTVERGDILTLDFSYLRNHSCIDNKDANNYGYKAFELRYNLVLTDGINTYYVFDMSSWLQSYSLEDGDPNKLYGWGYNVDNQGNYTSVTHFDPSFSPSLDFTIPCSVPNGTYRLDMVITSARIPWLIINYNPSSIKGSIQAVDVNTSTTDSVSANWTRGPGGEDSHYGWVETIGSGTLTGILEVTVTGGTHSASVNSVTNPVCYGYNTGAIDINVNGGSGNYTYSWIKNGSSIANTTQDLSGIGAGSYEVSVYDNGCPATASSTVTQPTPITSTVTSMTPSTCVNSADGSIYTTTTGGTPPYSYMFDSPSYFTNYLENTPSGTYELYVTDANGCEAIFNHTIGVEPQFTTVTVQQNQDATCVNTANGIIEVVGMNGHAPYTYSWNTNPVQTTAIANVLPSIYYIVSVTDNCGVVKQASGQAGLEAQFTGVTVQETQGATCGETAEGILTAAPNDGHSPYTYAWSSGETTAAINVFRNSPYNVIVTDACGIQKGGSGPTPLSPMNHFLEYTAATSGSANNEVLDVVSDAKGYVYTTGYFEGNISFNGSGTSLTKSSGTRSMFLAKYNGCGDLEWIIDVQGSSAGDVVEGHRIVVDDATGLIYVAGIAKGSSITVNEPGTVDPTFNTTNIEATIYSFDQDGYLDNVADLGKSSTTFIEISALKIDNNNELVAAVNYKSGTTIYNDIIGGYDLDFSGSYNWDYRCTGTNQSDDKIVDLVVQSTGNVYVVGNYKSGYKFCNGGSCGSSASLSGTKEAYIFKISSLSAHPSYDWLQKSTTTGLAHMNSITIDADDKMAMIGSFTANMSSAFGGSSVNKSGNENAFYTSINSNGSINQTKRIRANSPTGTYVKAADIAIGPNDQLYLLGYVKGTSDDNLQIGGNQTVTVSIQPSYYQTYLVESQFNGGTPIDGNFVESTTECIPTSMIMSPNGYLYFGGKYKGNVSVPVEGSTYTSGSTSGSGYSHFVMRSNDALVYNKRGALTENVDLNDQKSAYVEVPDLTSWMEVFPNPNNGLFTLKLNNINSSVVGVYDLYGKEVLQQKINTSGTYGLDLQHLAKGMYFVRALNAEDSEIRPIKLIIE